MQKRGYTHVLNNVSRWIKHTMEYDYGWATDGELHNITEQSKQSPAYYIGRKRKAWIPTIEEKDEIQEQYDETPHPYKDLVRDAFNHYRAGLVVPDIAKTVVSVHATNASTSSEVVAATDELKAFVSVSFSINVVYTGRFRGIETRIVRFVVAFHDEATRLAASKDDYKDIKDRIGLWQTCAELSMPVSAEDSIFKTDGEWMSIQVGVLSWPDYYYRLGDGYATAYHMPDITAVCKCIPRIIDSSEPPHIALRGLAIQYADLIKDATSKRDFVLPAAAVPMECS